MELLSKPLSLQNLHEFVLLSNETLHKIAAHLSLAPAPSLNGPCFTSAVLLELLICHHERRPSQLEAINSMPLYPTEDILWDENVVPSEFYNGESKPMQLQLLANTLPRLLSFISVSLLSPPSSLLACLALPKLNLQFLTLHDYLLRNLLLFRLESTCELPLPVVCM